MQNLLQNELNQTAEMRDQSPDELEQMKWRKKRKRKIN